MEFLLVLAVLAVAVLVIAGPLRAATRGTGDDEDAGTLAERAELESAKDVKLRQIREAELDYRTGKLAEEDWRELDATLRAEAIELLRRLDALGGEKVREGP